MNCENAKKINLVSYLAELGCIPHKIKGYDYYYLSPLRNEQTPSFHVNSKMNVWYDHGTGTGGTIIDFGIAYYHCSTSEFLQKLERLASFYQPTPVIKSDCPDKTYSEEIHQKIIILSAGSIISPALISYINQRKVHLDLAKIFCNEVHYSLYEKRYYAIGFKTDGGGFELRNARFKGCSKPKAIKFIDRGFSEVEVFEGFFSFLSFLTVIKNWELWPSNFLILNSLSLFNKSRELMEKHDAINLHLDRDKSGLLKTIEALTSSGKYGNASIAYLGYKDWNRYLTNDPNPYFLQIRRTLYAKKRGEINRRLNFR